MTMSQKTVFTSKKVVLAEGKEDGKFLEFLARSRLQKELDVCVVENLGGIGGSSGFANAAFGSETLPGFPNVTDVVFVADNDQDPVESISNLNTQLNKMTFGRKWGLPLVSGSTAMGNPNCHLWTWPRPGEPGCFETLLCRLIKRLHPRVYDCIEAAVECTDIGSWPIQKLDKARVRLFITVKHRRQPSLSLASLWRDVPDLLPVESVEFDEVCDFLNAV